MDRTGRAARALTAAAAMIIAVAAVLPPGGWIVRRQLEWQFRNPRSIAWASDTIGMGLQDESSSNHPVLPVADTARHHPDDVPLQIAAASTPEPRVDDLEQLADRAPANPAITAAILRAFMQSRRMDLESIEQSLPQPPSADSNFYPTSKQPPPSAADVAEFLRRAEQGQREDPGNGYFVAMRAIGLTARHQTARALSILSGVQRCSVWRDYDQAPVEGQWAAVQDGFGDHRATLHGLVVASALMPEYSELRRLGRIAVNQASRLEQHGHARDGVAIRHDVMECWALMRSSADSAIAVLLGSALVQMSVDHPDGAPHPSVLNQAPASQRVQLQLAAYQRFLQQHGFQQEARWAAREFAASQTARRILRAPDRHSDLSLNSIARRTGW